MDKIIGLYRYSQSNYGKFKEDFLGILMYKLTTDDIAIMTQMDKAAHPNLCDIYYKMYKLNNFGLKNYLFELQKKNK